MTRIVGPCLIVVLASVVPIEAQDKSPAQTITNSTGMKLVLIPAGTFTMGSPASEVNRIADEGPQHAVRISQPFYLGVYEVTQEEFQGVMGRNPSWFSSTGGGKDEVKGKDTTKFPVEYVNWFDAAEFCNKLSDAEGLTPQYELTKLERNGDQSIKAASAEFLTGTGYRLPTEAEWEYACRAGTTTPFHFGGTLNGDKANVNGNFPYGTTAKGKYLKRTTKVGSYPANAFGLFDMHGNVWEWCQDAYDAKAYASRSETTTDPFVAKGLPNFRVLRGGPWNTDFNGGGYRSATRFMYRNAALIKQFGFRVVLPPKPAAT